MKTSASEILAVVIALILPALISAQEHVSFPTQDGGPIHADMYGKGGRGVVLAHGGRFKKESWEQQGRALAEAGFRSLAIDFRGEGQSSDVLAAVHYLRKTGATSVSVVGASMGGDYAAEAAEAEPGEIDRLVLLAAGAYTPLVHMKGRKLFILSRDDTMGDDKKLRLPKIREQYERAADPKEFVILDGSAHAQFIFTTAQGERLMREIVRFLSAP
jgi:pimeloyl-ACP methyl ester carboxylesterase